MSSYTKEYWLEKNANLEIESCAFIAGKFVNASNSETYAVVNPATKEQIASVAACTEQDVDTAVKHARDSFEQGIWANQSPSDRKAVMKRLAELIREHQEELALLESINVGKPIMDAMNVDILGAAACFDWYAEAIDKIYGEVAPTDGLNIATITKEPVGVVGAIVPWNFPLDLAAWKLAPALISGNSVVLKPAEQSPHTALRIAALAKEAGLPDGVLSVVTGHGHIVGKAMGLHNDIDCITFTGSTPTAKLLMGYSAESNMKPVWPETGGKSPNLIFGDCELDNAVEHAARGIFFNQGEVCSANSRILVERSIKDAFIQKLKVKAESMVVGDPMDPDTQVGALIDSNHAAKVRAFIQEALDEGATLVTGGLGDCTTNSVPPTILDNVTPEMNIAREEVFGPVVVIMPFDDQEDAIALANDSIYGLAASVWTTNLNRAHLVSKRLKAGTVSVNTMDALDMSTPFGGYKQSGFGRDLSLHAFDKFTQLKTTWIKLG
ncbi:aldehyde dehydrogenase [Marinomonas balearica]|uniref:Gamma-glutamyl-gamma-aminobutyraldehyde dehydrogenase n=1 Tax=Marinomonas balearica TaxID=491947 RepID=A0A4R6MBB7_9GAMM|nr:aldehyde dehydrogenase [Marinomonas balearica]TDO97960.1 gamma-glutamyl-gamma-aminobutyraldehyde dehydrogenase [Marinomonas balearica]